MFRRATIKTIKGYLTSTGYIIDGFKTAFIHGYNNRMRRLGVESGTAGGLRPEQKENLDGLLKRFFIDGERSLLIEAPTGVGKTRIALEFVREFWRRRGRRCRVPSVAQVMSLGRGHPELKPRLSSLPLPNKRDGYWIR